MGASTPAAPDPKQQAAAQTGQNISTAVANNLMGNFNQVTPQGSLTYDQTGSFDWKDPYTGKNYQIPTFTATQSYTPEAQAIVDTNLETQGNLADLGAQQSGFLKDYMAKPVDLSNEATEARLYELGASRLDPRFAREEDQMRSNLLSRGVREGTPAWEASMSDFNQSKNDAYNQLLLSGRSQAVNEALTERNQPINEITALMSGSQVSNPNWVNPNTSTMPTTDVAGLMQQGYQNNMAASQQKNAFNQNVMGGLFGLGSSFLMSDRRVKTNIRQIGRTNDGQNIYSYRMKDGGPIQIGLMADEVESVRPEAVITGDDGVKRVSYERALEDA